MRQTLTDCPFVSISATNRAHKICEAKARPAHRWRAGPGITGLRGAVNIIRPNKSVIQIERFEPTEIFNNKEEAEAYAKTNPANSQAKSRRSHYGGANNPRGNIGGNTLLPV